MNEEIRWQKSSFSGANGADCMEIAHMDDRILVRESDDPDLIITTNPEKLRAFILGVKSGEFDHFVN
ncbi:DUF397 domain-containing protein [Streptomyces sp. TS71-3]|uniref:DUF397 domain-containing protein n=1 Tax=Streptomyces sp. TS71-3 TaxID=2733862 RepID=UPI001B1893B2|nr:DUF397 domain-containing protein [Streptomyces sp. TS71-3]GHJ39954.1 DUF397 domain-containing protein [Streptomyces sp. TS71-3]